MPSINHLFRFCSASQYLPGIVIISSLFIISCKTQPKVQVAQGAYVTIDGTTDGLSHIQTEFKDATRTSDGILVNLSSDVLFELNKSDLSSAAKKELDKVIQLLKNQPQARLEVSGHTDSTGPLAFNQRLSEQRAAAVKTYLVSKGMKAQQITTYGFGPTKPIASNNTQEGRLKNRRVEIKILD